MQKKWFLSFALVLLAGCGTLPFVSGEVRMSADELTQKMARRFPLEKSVAGLLDITLANPRVDLSEADNRITTNFHVMVKPMTGKTLSGTLRVSGRPEYLPDSRALYLRDARVDQIRMDNMPDGLSALLAKAASTMARDVLAEKPLHTFQAGDFTKYGVQYVPDRIVVRGDHLVLTLKP
ncbi:MAG: DUF1439 domain-containing protein [Betaproteobacteria bacterium]